MATQLTDAIAAHVLGEIQEVAQQIDGLTQKIEAAASVSDAAANRLINSMPAAAAAELQRASEIAATELTQRIVGVVGELAGDAAAAEKHKTFYLAALVTTAFAIFFYCAGLLAAGIDSTLTLMASSMLLTSICAMGFYWYMSGPKQIVKKGDFEPAFVYIDTSCTDYQFKNAIKSLTGDVNVINAARNVLIERMEISAAARKHRIHTCDLLKALGLIIERIQP